MASADWIHCNKCFIKYQVSAKFFLTSCGHLNCQNCASKINCNDNKCIVCNAPTKAVLLSKDLGHDVLAYFQPVSETLDKLRKGRPSGGHSFVTSTPMSLIPPSPANSLMSGIVNSPIIGSNPNAQPGGAYGAFAARGMRSNFNQSSHVVPVHNNTISSGGSVPSMNKRLPFPNSTNYRFGRP